MQISTALPLAFSQIGQRATNQDALYPGVGMATEGTQLFIICDGMGGADKGEVASQLLRDAVVSYASAMNNPILDTAHLRSAISWAYEAYQNYMQQHPLVGRMGSTLALVQLHECGATVAHVGDTRVYQLRGGKIIFQTQDHRQVNDMVEAGIITAAQAVTHPWRNRLSRAVVLASADTESASRSVPDCVVLTDIQPGDYFFMCTDGVLETIDNHTLEMLLSSEMPDQAKLQALLSKCNEQSKDNYSGYLIGIQYISYTDPTSHITRNYVV